jgi:hypothetical protein
MKERDLQVVQAVLVRDCDVSEEDLVFDVLEEGIEGIGLPVEEVAPQVDAAVHFLVQGKKCKGIWGGELVNKIRRREIEISNFRVRSSKFEFAEVTCTTIKLCLSCLLLALLAD